VPERKKKSNNLVIVESPSKAKTIEKYLGAGFEVMASYGHIRDLVKQHKEHKLGIDIEGGWVPFYKLSFENKEKGKERFAQQRKKNFTEMKKKAAKAEHVYLAPDPDREGEAIAWHLKEALALKEEQVRRVTFDEITKRAVQEAFQHPAGINMDLVNAQEARRFLDRVVGFPLSQLLRKKVSKAARSAGRVQSVAVRMIVERELEIEAFKPEEYWKITALLAPKGAVSALVEPLLARSRAQKQQRKFKKKDAADAKPSEDGDAAAAEEATIVIPPGSYLAELTDWQGKKFESSSGDDCAAIVDNLRKNQFVVSKIEQKDRPEKPQGPFTTSTLQQQASRQLHFPTAMTMRLAQQLYEGIDLGSEGRVGLITYMRTDSTRISKDAQDACRSFIKQHFGDKYVPGQPPTYASGKGAQEAHEAIRPSDLANTPQQMARYLTKQQLALYTLIYHRFVASQMTPAIFSVTKVEVTAGEGVFKAQGKVLKFDGYRKVLPPAKSEDTLLPDLREKQVQDLLDLDPSQHFTQPPPRFNEASLVSALEKEGIGRPSTYATIISKIQDVGYVEQRERRFYATDLGKQVTEQLVKFFPRVLDMKFTSQMEEELDQIAEQKLERNRVLDDFWGEFQKEYTVADKQMQAIRETGEICPMCGKPLVKRFTRGGGRQFVGCSGYPECTYTKPGDGTGEVEPPVETEHKCPTCGKMLLQKQGPRGPYLACSDGTCKTRMVFNAEGQPVLASKPTDHKCEKCGKPMVQRQGPRGPFLGCTGWPKCRFTINLDAEGNPVKEPDIGIKCEKCGSPMRIRTSFRGPFLGCSAYPKCKGTQKLTDEMKEKFKDLLPQRAPKKEMPKVEITEVCPQCGGEMLLRSGRGGTYFLGCKKYPKCKGTKEATPAILEQITPP